MRKFEGNPEHPGSRGRNCAKGPATLNQITDPDRILHPLRRVGPRGAGGWEQVSWEEALDDIAARIRKAIVEDRGQRGDVPRRPARVRTATRNACSPRGGSTGTTRTRTSARARRGPGTTSGWGSTGRARTTRTREVIVLISSASRVGALLQPARPAGDRGQGRGAPRSIVLDTRLSNTATHADLWLAPTPGSEAAILLAVASHLIGHGLYDREFVRRWWNWAEYLAAEHPDEEQTFASFERILAELYAPYTFELAERESGVSAGDDSPDG